MFWRSSSSSSSRRTYGLEATDLAASPALALLLCAPICLLKSFPGCTRRIYPPLALGLCGCFLLARPGPSRLRVAARPRRPPLQSGGEGVADLVDVGEFEPGALVLGDLLDVSLVAIGDDHLLDP